jgi:hypothetical protein
MSKDKVSKEKPLSPKKQFRSEVSSQIKTALTRLEEKLGKKEFDSRVKKATKLLTAGIKTKPVKIARTKALKKEISVVEERTA